MKINFFSGCYVLDAASINLFCGSKKYLPLFVVQDCFCFVPPLLVKGNMWALKERIKCATYLIVTSINLSSCPSVKKKNG